jgi:hypothetical protein
MPSAYILTLKNFNKHLCKPMMITGCVKHAWKAHTKQQSSLKDGEKCINPQVSSSG